MDENDLWHVADEKKINAYKTHRALWRRVRSFADDMSNLVEKMSPIDYLLHAVENSLNEPDQLIYDYDKYRDVCPPYHGIERLQYDAAVHISAYNVPDISCTNCPGFSLGSLDYYRSLSFRRYFNHLDRSGMFYYYMADEDLVRRISFAALAPTNKTAYFRHLGQSHGICRLCHSESTIDGPDDDEFVEEKMEKMDISTVSESAEKPSINLFEELWRELDARLNGLETSQLESGQTFSYIRKAEQEGDPIDVLKEASEEEVLSLPYSPFNWEAEFEQDLRAEQLVRAMMRIGGNH